MKTKKTCPVCDKEYTEKSRNRYRHFDPQTGHISWCKAPTPGGIPGELIERALGAEMVCSVCRQPFVKRDGANYEHADGRICSGSRG